MKDALETVRLATPGKGGQWDWFWALNFGEQMLCRRHMVTDGLGPDELATHLATDIDEACTRWRLALRVDRGLGSFDDDELEGDIQVTPVVGAQEACEMFGWRLATFHQWNYRRSCRRRT